MKTHPDNICSNCGSKIDAATHLEDETLCPKEGDISICAYCGTLGQYNEELKVFPMREDQMIKLFMENPDLAKEVLAVQSVFAFMKNKIQNKN